MTISDQAISNELQSSGQANLATNIMVSPLYATNTTTVVLHWWGFSFYMSSDLVKICVVTSSVAVGIIAAAIVGVVASAAVAAVAGDLVTVAAGYIASLGTFAPIIIDYNFIFGIQGVYQQ